jgi:hypothetical protein
MSELLRRYEPAECGTDGYPFAWREGVPLAEATSPRDVLRIPDLVRLAAGHRCVRCQHPYRTKQSNPEWSPCDAACRHGGEVRWQFTATGKSFVDLKAIPGEVAELLADGTIRDVQARYRVLTVHHLTGEKADCRWWNLAALCQRCHLYVQGRVKMHQVYPFEHTPWFRPYAAGYYAATILGEDLDRPTVERRQDELLALEAVA